MIMYVLHEKKNTTVSSARHGRTTLRELSRLHDLAERLALRRPGGSAVVAVSASRILPWGAS